MEPSGELPAGATCPPHHWLIDGEEGTQHWTCQRCGAEREHQDTSDEATPRPWRGFHDRLKPPSAAEP
jgi:hypothetical protein